MSRLRCDTACIWGKGARELREQRELGELGKLGKRRLT
jgi:hypothetical protein